MCLCEHSLYCPLYEPKCDKQKASYSCLCKIMRVYKKEKMNEIYHYDKSYEQLKEDYDNLKELFDDLQVEYDLLIDRLGFLHDDYEILESENRMLSNENERLQEMLEMSDSYDD